MSDPVRPHRRQPTRLPRPWDSPGKNTGVGRHFLLQGSFPTQGSNTDLLHFRQTLYRLSYKGSVCIYIYTYIFRWAKCISNIYLVFVHSSWLLVLKNLGISCDKSDKGVFCYVNEVSFGKSLCTLRMGH